MARDPKVLLMPSPVSSGSVGTVTKALGIARALQARGCAVRFAIGGELAGMIRQNGFEALDCPVPRPAQTTRPIWNVVDFIGWAGLSDADFVQAAVEAELAAIRAFRPDVIFAEARPSAAISAAAAGVPLVTIASWPMHPDFPPNRAAEDQPLAAFNLQLRRYSLPAIDHVAELLFLRSDIKISPSLPELEPELQAVPGVRFVGYMLDLTRDEAQLPPWYRAWRKSPLIFIYLSVGAINPDLYLQTVPRAFEGLDFDVLCACGFHYQLGANELPRAADNVRFVRFIPAQLIVEDARLVIFHGGQDTMLTTLLHGLPSITIPGRHFEREYNAMQLARSGASRMLPVHAFRPHRLRQVVREVLEGPYATNSQRLARRLRSYSGTEQGVEIILSAVK